MKKTYDKPELRVEAFDVEDVITTSSLETVGGGNESQMIPIGSLTNAPGTD